MLAMDEERKASRKKKSGKPKTWADRLKELRVRVGFTQAELAERIGTTRRSVISWEQGERDPLPVYQHAIEQLEKSA